MVSSSIINVDVARRLRCRRIRGQGKKPSERYVERYDTWVLPHFKPSNVKFDGSVVYVVRNAMIHESTDFTRGKHGFDRIIFMPPNRNGIVIEFCLTANCGGIEEAAFQVTILGMMEALERGVRDWLKDVRADHDKRREHAIEMLIQYRPQGQAPHIVGIPVIC